MKQLLLSILFMAAYFSSFSQTRLSNEQIMQKVATGKPFTLVILKSGKEMAKDDKNAQSLQMDHLAHLFQMEKEGKISIFGPINNDPTLRGIIVFNSTDKAAIKQDLDKDPFVKAGYMKYDLLDWFTIPGQKIPE